MKAIFSVLIFTAALLALDGWLIQGLHVGAPLTPDPEDVVRGFIGNLSASRFGSAREALDESLKQAMDTADLKSLARALQDKYGSYEYRPGGDFQEQGDQASYHAMLKTGNGGIQPITFMLEREPQSRIWRISSLDELARAANWHGGE